MKVNRKKRKGRKKVNIKHDTLLLSGFLIVALGLALPLIGVSVPTPLAILSQGETIQLGLGLSWSSLNLGSSVNIQVNPLITVNQTYRPLLEPIEIFIDDVSFTILYPTAFGVRGYASTTWTATTVGSHVIKAVFDDGTTHVEESLTLTIYPSDVPTDGGTQTYLDAARAYLNYFTIIGIAFIVAGFVKAKRGVKA